MAGRIASLYAEIGLKTDKLDAGLNKAKGSLNKAGEATKPLAKGIDGVSKSFAGLSLAGGALVIGGAKVIQFFQSTVREAEEVARTQAQLTAVIKSTGGAAGVTTNQINDMSTELSGLTGVEDDLITKNSALMLTFTKVSSKIFPDAMKAAINMSAVMGTDLQGSVIQLGKALNDPIQGITALKRVGVSFTKDQLDVIKSLVATGKVAEAQGLILAELNTEFGGAAEAMHKAGTGSDTLGNSVGNLKEEIGKGLIPTTRTATKVLNDYVISLTDSIAAENALLDAAEKGIITKREANAMVNKMTWTSYSTADAVVWLADKSQLYNQVIASGIKMGEIRAVGMRENIELTQELGDETDRLKAEYADLSTILGGDLTRKTQEYNSSLYDLRVEAGVLTSTIDRLEGMKYLTTKQKEELIEAKKKLGENQNAVKELAEEHDKATKEIILGFVQQAAAADGVITQQEFDKIAALGKAWGIYDKMAAAGISNSKAYLEDAGMSVDEFDRKIDAMSTSVWDAYAVTRDFAEEWAKLKDKKITLTMHTKYTYATEGGIRPGAGRQHGGPVMGGIPYMVGEKGPEMFVPSSSGHIVPNSKVNSSSIIIQEQNIYIEGGDSDTTADAVLSRFAEASRAAANAGISYAG